MTTAWPRRTDLCLDCRTALAPGAPCAPGHRVRTLAVPAGREQLLETVWGPKPLRDRMRALVGAGATGGTTGGVLGGLGDCSGCDVGGGGALGAILMAVIACALVFVVVAWLAGAIRDYLRRRRARLEPNGAVAPPFAAPYGGRAGTVVGAPAASPLSSRRCTGYAAELSIGGAVMLRDAATIGFEVALDGGERVRIPPGPLLVDGAGEPVALSEHHVDLYLRGLDPARDGAADLDPFPRDRVEELLIGPGDRVEVLGRLRPIADGAAPATGYRDAAATVLVPEGRAWVRRLDREQP